MPTNITKGNAAQFIIEFIDVNGNLTIPPGGELDIEYTLGITTASTALTLSPLNSYFTATWNSSVADYGPATWRVFAIGSTTTAASSGELRILDTTA